MTQQTERLVVGGADAELDAALDAGLTAYNNAATGHHDQRELTVQVRAEDGALRGGLSGWTWGPCAGMSMVWVRDEDRGGGLGSRLVEAFEAEARARGCTHAVVSSFTFQAPGFYERHGYVETGRMLDVPRRGDADVHFHKDLTGAVSAG